MEVMEVEDGLLEDTEDGKVAMVEETMDTMSTPPMFHHIHHLSMSDQMLHQFTLDHMFQLFTLDHTFHRSIMEPMHLSTMLGHTCLSSICHPQSPLFMLDQWDHQCTYHLPQLSIISLQLFTINPMLLVTLRTITMAMESLLVEIILVTMVLATLTLVDRDMELAMEMVDMQGMGTL